MTLVDAAISGVIFLDQRGYHLITTRASENVYQLLHIKDCKRDLIDDVKQARQAIKGGYRSITMIPWLGVII